MLEESRVKVIKGYQVKNDKPDEKGSVLLNMLTGTQGRANYYWQRSYIYGTYQKKTKRCAKKVLLQRNQSLKITAGDI